MARKLRPDEEREFTTDASSADPLLEEELLREFTRLGDVLGDERRGQNAASPPSGTDPRSEKDPEKSK